MGRKTNMQEIDACTPSPVAISASIEARKGYFVAISLFPIRDESTQVAEEAVRRIKDEASR